MGCNFEVLEDFGQGWRFLRVERIWSGWHACLPVYSVGLSSFVADDWDERGGR